MSRAEYSHNLQEIKGILGTHRQIRDTALAADIKPLKVSSEAQQIIDRANLFLPDLEDEYSSWLEEQSEQLSSFFKGFPKEEIYQRFESSLVNTIKLELRTLDSTLSTIRPETSSYIRDVIRYYAITFVECLKSSQRFGLTQKQALLFAERAYYYDPNLPFTLSRQFPQLSKGTIMFAITHKKPKPKAFLEAVSQNIERLIPLYPDLPSYTIENASTRSVKNPEKDLNTIREKLHYLRGKYSTILDDHIISVTVFRNIRNAEDKLEGIASAYKVLTEKYPSLQTKVIKKALYYSDPEDFIIKFNNEVKLLEEKYQDQFSSNFIRHIVITHPATARKTIERLVNVTLPYLKQKYDVSDHVITEAIKQNINYPESFIEGVIDFQNRFPTIAPTHVLWMYRRVSNAESSEHMISTITTILEQNPDISILALKKALRIKNDDERTIYIENYYRQTDLYRSKFRDVPPRIRDKFAANFQNENNMLEIHREKIISIHEKYPDISIALLWYVYEQYNDINEEIVERINQKTKELIPEFPELHPKTILRKVIYYGDPQSILDRIQDSTITLTGKFPYLRKWVVRYAAEHQENPEEYLSNVEATIQDIQEKLPDASETEIIKAVVFHPEDPEAFLFQNTNSKS